MYEYEAIVHDKYGNAISTVGQLALYSTTDKNAFPLEPWTLITVQSHVEPGEKATFKVGTAFQNATLYYELAADGKIIARKYMKVSPELTTLSIPVPETVEQNWCQVNFLLVCDNRTYSFETSLYVNHPPVQQEGPPTSLMGGAGLAISSKTKRMAECLAFMQYILSEEIQKGLYYQEQGQPAHLSAWLDGDNNRDCSGFFSDTLETMRNAYVRPRYKSFNRFQEAAADYVHEIITGDDPLVRPVTKLNVMYQMILNG